MKAARTTVHVRELDLRERDGTPRCFACDSLDGVRVTGVAHAIGASTGELDDFLFGIPLCADCAAHSHDALRTSRRTLLTLPLLPLVVTSTATFLLPLPVWATAVLYALGVLSSGVAIGALRRRRARLAPALVLEGHGQTLRLQVATRQPTVDPAHGPYRESSAPGLEPTSRPRPPADGLAIYWPAAAVVGGALALWAWLLANPIVVLDNAGGLTATVRIDASQPRVVSGRDRKTLRVHVGSHWLTVRPSVGKEERFAAHVQAGRNYLFAITPRSCYEVSTHSTSRPHRWSNIARQQTTGIVTDGRWIAIGAPEDVSVTACPPVPFQGF